MMYITEAPVRFGLLTIPLLIAFVIVIFSLSALTQEEEKLTPALFLLTFLWAFLLFATIGLSIALLPASATIHQLLPYYKWAGLFLGLHLLFSIYYTTAPTKWNIGEGPQWINALIALAAMVFMALVFLIPNTTNASVVTDEILNYLVMPLPVVIYGSLFSAFSLFFVDTYVVFELEPVEWKESQRFWARMFWFAGELWLVVIILGLLLQFIASYMLWVFGLAAVTWIILLIAMVKFSQAQQQESSEMESGPY